MNVNPYGAPQSPTASAVGAAARTPFALAAAGAWLASAYWAMMTLLIALGVTRGAGSGAQLILPCVLIALYASRGYKLFKGDRRAVHSILWLHGVGFVMAVGQVIAGASTALVVLQSLKILVHVFGGFTAFLAYRALARGQLPPAS